VTSAREHTAARAGRVLCGGSQWSASDGEWYHARVPASTGKAIAEPAEVVRRPGRARIHAALPLLIPLLLLVPWSIRAVVVDNTPGDVSNSIEAHATRAAALIERGAWPELFQQALHDPKNPPVSVLFVGFLLVLFGRSLTVLRLGGVLCYALLIAQTYDLARHAGGGRWTASWAALLCGSVPLLFGWTRLAYADVYVTVFVIGCLQLMIRGHLNRRRAALLGALAGLGVLTKLGFVVSMVVPGLWFVVGHLSRAEHRRNLLLAVLVGAVAVGWWLAMLSGREIGLVLNSATQATVHQAPLAQEHDLLHRKLSHLVLYLWSLRGVTLLWAGAAAGLCLCRRAGRRPQRALLGLASLGGLGFWLLLDPDPRYVLPLLPPAAVLTAAGLAAALGRALGARPERRRWLELALAAALWGWVAWVNLVPTPRPGTLFFQGDGMVSPNAEYLPACRELNRHVEHLVTHYWSTLGEEWLTGNNALACRRCWFPNRPLNRRARCVVAFDRSSHGPRHHTVPVPGCPSVKPIARFAARANLGFELRSGDRP